MKKIEMKEKSEWKKYEEKKKKKKVILIIISKTVRLIDTLKENVVYEF